jgi:hypothetical protein
MQPIWSGTTPLHKLPNAPYMFSMPPAINRLDDLRLHGLNLRVECSKCGHSGVFDGPVIWRWFALNQWDGALDKISRHLMCSVCRNRPAAFAPTSDAPTVLFGPKNEAEWKSAVQRLRR